MLYLVGTNKMGKYTVLLAVVTVIMGTSVLANPEIHKSVELTSGVYSSEYDIYDWH